MDRTLEQRVGWRIEDDYSPNQIRLLQQTALFMGNYGLGKIEVIEGQRDSLGDTPEKGRERVVVCGQGLPSLTAFKDIFGFAREVGSNLQRFDIEEDELNKEISNVIKIQVLRSLIQRRQQFISGEG